MNETILYATAAIVTGAGVTAVVVNRFCKVLAGSVTLMAGVCPWLMIGGFFTNWSWLRSQQWAGVFGLFGAPLLFVIAFFLYGLGKVTPRRGFAAGASLIGMFAALGNTLLWFHLLSKMP